jgi:peptide/nickel transport system permease protein
MTADDRRTGRPRVASAARWRWRGAVYRFRQSWLSVMGLGLSVGLILLVALFGPLLAPYPEHVAGQGDVGSTASSRRRRSSGSAPTSSGQDVLSVVMAGRRSRCCRPWRSSCWHA